MSSCSATCLRQFHKVTRKEHNVHVTNVATEARVRSGKGNIYIYHWGRLSGREVGVTGGVFHVPLAWGFKEEGGQETRVTQRNQEHNFEIKDQSVYTSTHKPYPHSENDTLNN